MPAYDYRCDSCGISFEVRRALGDRSRQHCPDCGAEAKRVFSSVGIVFKGSGFHNTDYKPRPSESTGSSESRPSDGASGCAGGSGSCAACPAGDD